MGSTLKPDEFYVGIRGITMDYNMGITCGMTKRKNVCSSKNPRAIQKK
jgi:hypothetical protein